MSDKPFTLGMISLTETTFVLKSDYDKRAALERKQRPMLPLYFLASKRAENGLCYEAGEIDWDGEIYLTVDREEVLMPFDTEIVELTDLYRFVGGKKEAEL